MGRIFDFIRRFFGPWRLNLYSVIYQSVAKNAGSNLVCVTPDQDYLKTHFLHNFFP